MTMIEMTVQHQNGREEKFTSPAVPRKGELIKLCEDGVSWWSVDEVTYRDGKVVLLVLPKEWPRSSATERDLRAQLTVLERQHIELKARFTEQNETYTEAHKLLTDTIRALAGVAARQGFVQSQSLMTKAGVDELISFMKDRADVVTLLRDNSKRMGDWLASLVASARTGGYPAFPTKVIRPPHDENVFAYSKRTGWTMVYAQFVTDEFTHWRPVFPKPEE